MLPSGFNNLTSQAVKSNQGGLYFVLNNVNNEYMQIRVSQSLGLDQNLFKLSQPNTFYTLRFNEDYYFKSEYSAPNLGILVTKYNYSQEKQWGNRFESKWMRPFPWLTSSQLIFSNSNYADSVTMAGVSESNGIVTWKKDFALKSLFGLTKGYLAYGYTSENYFLHSYESEKNIFHLTLGSTSNGEQILTNSLSISVGQESDSYSFVS